MPHLLAPLTADCRGFREQWAAVAGAGEPGGRWTGEWRSAANGHHGRLECALQVLGEGRWRATFRAGYAGVLRACYGTDFAVAARPEGWTFSGRSDLGRLAGGVYEFDGNASAGRFVARYRSKYDHGTFTLTRAAE